jgi:hypothetical protein
MDYYMTMKQRIIDKTGFDKACGSQLLKNDEFGFLRDGPERCASWLPSAAKAVRDSFSRYNLDAATKSAKSCAGGRRNNGPDDS